LSIKRKEKKMNSIVSGILGNTLRRYLVIALAVSLTVTGGMFAYAFTTATSSLSVSGSDTDFCSITSNVTVPQFSPLGSYRGKINEGAIFTFTPDSNYTGDIAINVYLDNAYDIGYKYGMFMLTMDIVDPSDNTSKSIDGRARVLSLNNGVVTLVTTSTNITYGNAYNIRVSGGSFRTFPGAYLSYVTSQGSWIPSLTAEVVQAGL
jgi:hypothetical protein